MWATGLQYPVIWCTTSQPKLSSLSYTTRKTRNNFMVSKVDFEQRKNGQNMTFWSTILEGLRVLSKWLVASHLQARVFLPRLEYLGPGPPQGSRPTRDRQLRTERVVTILIPDHQFATPPLSTWRGSVQDLLVNGTTKSSQVCTTKHSPPDCCLIFRVASSAFRIILL